MGLRTKADFRLSYTLLIGGLLFFLFSCLARVSKPVAQDDLGFLVAAQNLFHTGIPGYYGDSTGIVIQSPHLYLRSIYLAFKLFGASEMAAKIPGITAGVLSVVLIFLIVKAQGGGDVGERMKAASLTSLLYATSPVFIQGALIVDIDSGVFIPLTLLLFWSFIKLQKEKRFRWAVMTAAATTLALWARVTTPLVMIALFCFYALLFEKKAGWKIVSFGSIFLGVVLFFVSWYLYCRFTALPFSIPFQYVAHILGYRTKSPGGFSFSQVIQNLTYLTLWVGPFLSLLLFLLSLRWLRSFTKAKQLWPEDLYLVCGGVILAGYTFVGGTPFGFPKLHAPGIALLFVYLGLAIGRMRNLAELSFKKIILLTAAALLVQIFSLGDFLYVLRYEMREAALSGMSAYAFTTPGPMAKGILFVAVSSWLMFISRKFLGNLAILEMLVLFSLGSNLALASIQNAVPYHTGYNYGGWGTVETARFIRERIPEKGVVIAPSEVIHYLNLLSSPHLRDTVWKDLEEFKVRLSDDETSAFAISIATNTVDSMRMILSDEKVRGILEEKFDFFKVGSFQVWIRKGLSRK